MKIVNLKTKRVATGIAVAFLSPVTLIAQSNPNFGNATTSQISTQLDQDLNNAMAWISWALWIVWFLAFVYGIYAFAANKPEKNAVLVTLGVVTLLAGIATVIFGL